ncbi:MAG: tRNA glutamyl-Q(34) synthetase GluQRS [Opitutus sp.]|nr:tRNA glutamyl-Q(34) synthetase GluQRS [Opitutus sp.]
MCPFVVEKTSNYRGRLAPSPTGYLHLGHARTFWIAQERARAAGGELILRNDDLDAARCKPEFVTAMLDDLRWFGLGWVEGPDLGGPHTPYNQSQRVDCYADVFDELRAAGVVYPCTCSRKDVQSAVAAPHGEPSGGRLEPAPGFGDEPHYPGTCRPENLPPDERLHRAAWPRDGVNWRFRVPDGVALEFTDGHFGPQQAVTGRDFTDFLVWRKDNVPSYQLACVADDVAMRITEVVRGADLLLSTFRQLLLYRALGRVAPLFFHCPLVTDDRGTRLAKRHDALSLRALREQGRTPEELRATWAAQ